jgi:BirA family biotin operon repressor/biotin-[acetyl-CoA-carboxylase] ligase
LTPESGYRVRHFDRIDSTNAEARRLHEAGEQGPLWLVAEAQTAGRGRLGRQWVSEPGNLYATLLLPLAGVPASAAQIGFVAALAVHDVVAAALGPGSVRIKWPNDVLVGGAKIAGILAEVLGLVPLTVALGCGVNVAHHPAGLNYRVTSLRAEGSGLDAPGVFHLLDRHLGRRLRQWQGSDGFASIRADWLNCAVGLGQRVTVAAPAGDWPGLFRGLAADGAALVQGPDGREVVVHAGDIRFASADPPAKDEP